MSVPKKKRRCDYELCDNNKDSVTKQYHIDEDTRAGGQDWSALAGWVLCKICYDRYSGRGTLERSARIGPVAECDRRCTYEGCEHPLESKRYHHIAKSSKSGGQDWTPLAGSILCGSCYHRYKKRGTLERAAYHNKPLEEEAKVCTNASCPQPHKSRQYHRIDKNKTAGGRDWSSLDGEVLCYDCYHRFRRFGRLNKLPFNPYESIAKRLERLASQAGSAPQSDEPLHERAATGESPSPAKPPPRRAVAADKAGGGGGGKPAASEPARKQQRTLASGKKGASKEKGAASKGAASAPLQKAGEMPSPRKVKQEPVETHSTGWKRGTKRRRGEEEGMVAEVVAYIASSPEVVEEEDKDADKKLNHHDFSGTHGMEGWGNASDSSWFHNPQLYEQEENMGGPMGRLWRGSDGGMPNPPSAPTSGGVCGMDAMAMSLHGTGLHGASCMEDEVNCGLTMGDADAALAALMVIPPMKTSLSSSLSSSSGNPLGNCPNNSYLSSSA
eukprot:CAMPEP_0173421992 /NCGR_PEP_ID=MMETSP1357-20121228/2876_1 /TAXON_ID=77926 /ORGANISM="Hemiselmis rufescens, Strain PCC563" /LENGTH=498 /DNA_ID=CAMNT_0014384965 /DNA_START=56 /DNA_END=1552 /DNA_ORIENTATION=+